MYKESEKIKLIASSSSRRGQMMTMNRRRHICGRCRFAFTYIYIHIYITVGIFIYTYI